MSDFLKAYQRTMGNEGGWKSADDTTDSGGETYKGITRNNFPRWGGWKYIDGVKAQMVKQPAYGTSSYYVWAKSLNTSLAQINALQALVQAFYRDNFWHRLSEIADQRIAETIFDLDVNSGSMGSKLMQRAAGVTDDGDIGPRSIEAINAADPRRLLTAFNAHAIEFYEGIINKHPEKAKYRHSWLSRLKDYDGQPFVEV